MTEEIQTEDNINIETTENKLFESTNEERETIKNVGWLDRGARLISFLLHPFIMPALGVVILLYARTVVSMLPPIIKMYTVGVLILNTIIIPAICIALLYKFGIISSLSIDKRKDRVTPIAIVAMSYVLSAYILKDYLVIDILRGMLYAAFISLMCCFTINLRWKISLHMTAIGGVTGMILAINMIGYGQVFPILIVMLMLSGLLASARLYLGKHNINQIAAGFFLGLFIMLISLSLFR